MTSPTPKGPAAHLAPEAEPSALVDQLLNALRPFAAIAPSSLYPPDGSEGEGYSVLTFEYDRLGHQAAPDFTGSDLAAARAACDAAREHSSPPSSEREGSREDPLPSPTPEGLVEDGRPIGDTPWRRFRDEKPTYDGWGERHFLTWNTRVASYDVGCIDGQWSVGEAIDGHPDDLWRWLDSNPERDDAASRIEALEGERGMLVAQVQDAVEGAQPLWSGNVARLEAQVVRLMAALELARARALEMHDWIAEETDHTDRIRKASAFIADLDHLLSLHPEGGSSACTDLGYDGPRAASESPGQSEGGE